MSEEKKWELRNTTFEDSNGETWSVEVNAFTVDDTLKETGVDLYEIVTDGNGNLFERLAKPRTLVAVLFCCCQDQIEKRQMEPEDFARRLASGEAIEGATEALINGIVNFFPPKRRHLLIQLLEKGKQMEQAVTTRAQQLLDSGVMEKKRDQLLEKYDATFFGAAASLDLEDQAG